MNQDNLKRLLQDLKIVVMELESEIYSDPSSYSSNILNLDLGSVLQYEDTNDNDSEEGL